MIEYKVTPLQTLPKRELKQSAESRFWNKYQKVFEKQCDNAVSVLTTSNHQNLSLFAHNFNIEVFSGKTKKIDFTISKFTPELTGASFRKDGIFCALGETSGKVKILDTTRKQYARDHNKHKKSVQGLAFSSENTIQGSASDDRNIIFYDYAINEIVKVYSNFHTDNIRTLRAFPNDGNLFLTGSHDFSMKMIDLRESLKSNNPDSDMMDERTSIVNCLEFNHGCEVEDLAIFNEGSLFVSVGGTKTMLWDVRRNERPILEINSNTKTISCVKIIESGKRVLTGSYDQFLKIYDQDMKFVHQKKMQAPIMNMGVSYDMESITFGYANGIVEILNRPLKNVVVPANEDLEVAKNENDYEFFEKKLIKDQTFGVEKKDTGSRKFYGRGVYAKPGAFDVKIDAKNSKRLQKFDRKLRKFKYGEALSDALESKNTIIILSVFEELLYRNGLKKALEKKNNEFYRNFLIFILKKIDSANCQSLLMHIFDQFQEVFDLRENGSDKIIDDLLNKIKAKISKEVEIITKTIEQKGIIEALDL